MKQIQDKYETNIRRVGESQYETCCHNCHQLFAAPQPRFVQFSKTKMTKKTHFALLPKKKMSQKTLLTQETEVSLFELFEDTTFPNTGGLE